MNKKFVYQVGNNKKVILWSTANQISRFTDGCLCNIKLTCREMYACQLYVYNSLECSAFWVRVLCSLVCGYCRVGGNFCFHRQVRLWIYATSQYHNPDYHSIKIHHLVTLMSHIIINMIMKINSNCNNNNNNNNNNMQHTVRATGT